MTRKAIATPPGEKTKYINLTKDEVAAREARIQNWLRKKQRLDRENAKPDLDKETTKTVVKALAEKINLTVGDIEKIK